MSIEEAFGLIRNFLDDIIKKITNEIEKKEKSNKFLEKNIKKGENYKSSQSRLGIELVTKVKVDLEKEIANDIDGINICYRMKSYFGKNRILRKVDDFGTFLVYLNFINKGLNYHFEREMIAKIIGMAIYTNNSIYEESPRELKKDLNSKDENVRNESKAILDLKPYFSFDGAIIANEDVNLFVDSLFIIFISYFNSEANIESFGEKNSNVSNLILLMKQQLLNVNSSIVFSKEDMCSISATVTNTSISKKQRRKIIEQQRLNEQELVKYFDGEKILIPCTSIEEFEILVENCNLSEENKSRIITKMKTFLARNHTNNISFLTVGEQEIYKVAIEKQLGNVQIKTNLEEINLLLEMYKETSSIEDKIYIEDEVRTIIESLRFMLNINLLSLNLQN